MGLKINLLIVIAITCFLNCSYSKKNKPSKINYDLRKSTQYVKYNGKVDTIYKTDTVYSSFKIFASGNLYTYKANYYNSSGTCLSTNIIKIKGTDEKFTLAPSQRAAKFLYRFKTKDSIAFSPHPLNRTLSLWNRKIVEGVIENQTMIWMHPFRHNQFIWTEIMAYPEIILPIKDGYKWQGKVDIPQKSWGDWEGKTINSDYLIQGKEIFEIRGRKISCWQITAKSTMDGRVGQSKFLFNPHCS